MRVLMIEPDKIPYETEIDGSLESMQTVVGGNIEAYYPYADLVAIVCNDEGKINGLPLNRAIYGDDGQMNDIIAGAFFITGLSEESFADLPAELMNKYLEMFKHSEKFVRLAGEIIAVKQPISENVKEHSPVTSHER